jgi:hypothetical protein
MDLSRTFLKAQNVLETKKLHFNFIYLLLLYHGYQHVSATHVTIFRVDT